MLQLNGVSDNLWSSIRVATRLALPASDQLSHNAIHVSTTPPIPIGSAITPATKPVSRNLDTRPLTPAFTATENARSAIWPTITVLPALLQEPMLPSWAPLPILATPLASKHAPIKPLPIRRQELAILAISRAWHVSIVLIIALAVRADTFGPAGRVIVLAQLGTSLILMVSTAPNAFLTARPATAHTISARSAQYQGSTRPFFTMYRPPIQPVLVSVRLASTDKLTTVQVLIFASLVTPTALYALVIPPHALNANQLFTFTIARVSILVQMEQ